MKTPQQQWHLLTSTTDGVHSSLEKLKYVVSFLLSSLKDVRENERAIHSEFASESLET